jgi:hypothetical protein
MVYPNRGDHSSTVVKVLHYKSEGRGSIPGGDMEFFIDINPSNCPMPLGLTQSLI